MGLRHTFQQMAFIITTFSPIFNVTVLSLTVHQPPALNVTAGGTAVMVCTFDIKIMWSAKASWTRSPRGNRTVDLDNPEYNGRLTKSTLDQTMERKAIMNISDVRVSDSDIYYCEIVITNENKSSDKKEKGNGTVLTVIEDQKVSKESHGLLYWILIPLAVIIPALVISVILYLRKESSVAQLDAKGATPMMAEMEESLHYAQINLQKMDHTAPLKDNTPYARLNLRASVHYADTQKDNIRYAQQTLLQTKGVAPMKVEMGESLHYAQINLQKMDQTAPLKDNTLYAQLNLPASVHATDTQKHNIHYPQQNLLQTEVNTT